MNIRPGCRSLVGVNVHFEPELTLRGLRERLRLISPHWPLYPEAAAVIMGDFNIFKPEEGTMFVIRPSPAVIRQRLPSFIPSLSIQGETLQSVGLYGRRPGLIERLSIFLRLKHATSNATPMFLRTWENGPYRVTMQPYVWLSKLRLFG